LETKKDSSDKPLIPVLKDPMLKFRTKNHRTKSAKKIIRNFKKHEAGEGEKTIPEELQKASELEKMVTLKENFSSLQHILKDIIHREEVKLDIAKVCLENVRTNGLKKGKEQKKSGDSRKSSSKLLSASPNDREKSPRNQDSPTKPIKSEPKSPKKKERPWKEKFELQPKHKKIKFVLSPVIDVETIDEEDFNSPIFNPQLVKQRYPKDVHERILSQYFGELPQEISRFCATLVPSVSQSENREALRTSKDVIGTISWEKIPNQTSPTWDIENFSIYKWKHLLTNKTNFI